MRTLLLIVLVLALAAPVWAQAVPPFDITRLYLTEAAFNRAIQPYQQAIQVSAQNARAHYWLGYAYVYAYRQYLVGAAPYAGGYLTRAERPLQEAIRLNPTMVEAYAQLHDVYQFMGDLDKAQQTVELMLQRTRPGWLPAVGLPAPAPTPTPRP